MPQTNSELSQLLRDMGFSEEIVQTALAKCGSNCELCEVLECIERMEETGGCYDNMNTSNESKINVTSPNIPVSQADAPQPIGINLQDCSANKMETAEINPDKYNNEPDSNIVLGNGATAATERELIDDQMSVLRCEECNTLFGKEKASRHAEQTGHCKFVQASKEEKVERIKEMRKRIEEHRKHEEIERERKRREDGKKIGGIKAEMKQLELKRAAEQRVKERKLDAMHRAHIKSQIKADRVAFKQKSFTTLSQSASQPLQSADSNVAAAPVVSDECRVMVRLGDGRCLVNTFKQKEQLSAVRLWIALNHPDGERTETVRLIQTYPRKEFETSELQQTIEQLKLGSSVVFTIR